MVLESNDFCKIYYFTIELYTSEEIKLKNNILSFQLEVNNDEEDEILNEEFKDYPKYKQLYINAFDRMLEARRQKGKKDVWKDGQEVFDWWLEVGKHEVKGQYKLFDEGIYG